MLVNKAAQLTLLTAAMLWQTRTDAATSVFKICGRELSDVMSKVCHAYNGPSWDVPTVVEQPAAVVRRRRQIGIADECCAFGCSFKQLSEYCSVSKNIDFVTIFDGLETHMIEDRSAEQDGGAGTSGGGAVQAPAQVAQGAQRVKTAREGARGGARRREALVRSAARAAPVVGTVSPLLTWGRTLNTNLPPIDRDRYAYVVYST